MVNRVQTLRSSTPGNRPAVGSRAPGELYVNWPDGQIGVINASQAPQDLLVVRPFSSLSSYNAGDYVIQAQQLYQANVPITPGAFNAAQWQPVPDVVVGTAPPQNPGPGELWFDDVGMQLYIYYNDGNSSQWVPTTNQAFSGIFLALSGGTITGNLTVQGTTTLGAATGVTPTAGDVSTKLATTAFMGTLGATTAPLMNGTANPGVSALFARADHVHPSDTAKYNTTGGAISGNVTISGTLGMSNISLMAGGYAIQTSLPSYFGADVILANNAHLNAAATYVGEMSATLNSLGGNGSYIWGSGHYSNWSGGGGMFSRVDTNAAYLCGWLWGASSLIGTISTNGSTVSYNTGSDRRFKTNIRDLTDDLDPGEMIDAMRPVAFEWINRFHNSFEPATFLQASDGMKAETPASRRATKVSHLGHGFVAQELIQVAPFAVHAPDDGESDLVAEFGEPGFTGGWGVDASKLVPYLVAEIQNLRRRVEQLEGAR